MRNSRWYPKRDQTQRDTQITKEEFANNWDNIFGKKEKVEEPEEKVEDDSGSEEEQ